MVYPYLELHILFYSDGLAIWSGFPDITHIKKILPIIGLFGRHDLVSVQILPNFELTELLEKWISGINFRAKHNFF